MELINERHIPPTIEGADGPWSWWVSEAELVARTARYTVEVHWSLLRGRYEPRLFAVRGHGDAVVSASLLRRLPSGAIIERLRSHLADLIDRQVRAASEHRGDGEGRLTVDGFAEHRARVRAAAASPEALGEAQAMFTATTVAEAVLRGTAGAKDVAGFGAQRGRRLAPDDLAAVAEAYRAAWSAGRPVQASVAEAVGISKSAAAKRIMAARRAGLLEGMDR